MYPYIYQIRDYDVTSKDDDDTLAKKAVVHGVCMFELLPLMTKCKALLIPNLLKLTRTEYHVQKVLGTVSTRSDEEEGLGGPGIIRLDEDCDIVEVKL